MRAVDTNVLVRLATHDDRGQAAAAAEFIAGGAWVSQVVLAETIWVLASTYGLSSEKIGVAVELFLNHRDLAIQDGETVAAALDRFRQRPSVGFPDCLDSRGGAQGRTPAARDLRPRARAARRRSEALGLRPFEDGAADPDACRAEVVVELDEVGVGAGCDAALGGQAEGAGRDIAREGKRQRERTPAASTIARNAASMVRRLPARAPLGSRAPPSRTSTSRRASA